MARRSRAEESSEPVVADVRRKGTTINATFVLPHSLNVRLTAVAAGERMSKSAFAVKLLDQSLRRFKLDETLRSGFGDFQGEDDAAA